MVTNTTNPTVNALQFKFKKVLSIDLNALVISGPRLSLHALQDRFAADIFAEFTKQITRYMVPTGSDDIRDTYAFIAESRRGMSDKTEAVFAIVSNSGEFLGCCGLHGRATGSTPELGIWIKKSAHGQKYGREAITTLFAWAKDNIHCDYFIYPVDRANIASRKIPESLGGEVYQRVQKKSLSGELLDEVIYKIAAGQAAPVVA